MKQTTKLRYLPNLDTAALEAVLLAWQSRWPGMGVCALLPKAQKDGLTWQTETTLFDAMVPNTGTLLDILYLNLNLATRW